MFHQLGLRAFQIGSLHRIHRAAGQTGQHDQFIIHVVDVRSNDDLILSARVHGAHDAFGLFESIGIKLGTVCQLKAQSGSAVHQTLDVLLAADRSQDLRCQLFVIHDSFLSCSCKMPNLRKLSFWQILSNLFCSISKKDTQTFSSECGIILARFAGRP